MVAETTASSMTRAIALALCLALSGSARADEWTGPDKTVHFAVSASIAAGLGVTVHHFTGSTGDAVSSGLVGALLAGVAKELLDLAGLGTPSWKDLAWDALGAATGAIFTLLWSKWVAPRIAGAHGSPLRVLW